MLTCDGQTAETLHAGESFEVSKAAFRLHLVHPENYSYFNILRNKLRWGRGPELAPGPTPYFTLRKHAKMLKNLSIRNLAIIDLVELDFEIGRASCRERVCK